MNWATLKAQIARKLDDPTYNKYSEDLLEDGVNDALAAFASAHTGIASDFEITGDGSTYDFDLPDGIVESEGKGVYAVHWEKNAWLKELEYWPGKAWKSSSRSTSTVPKAYVLWPRGKISFTRIPDSGQAITVHYVAHYPIVSGDTTEILVPRWAREAIKLYVAANALEPTATSTGDLRRWNKQRDSGNPEDNPVLQLAHHYMQRYYDILAQHPAPQYDKLVRPAEGLR